MVKKNESDEIETPSAEDDLQSRRDFLIGLKKWSKAVIGGAVAATVLGGTPRDASAGWINRRGGGRRSWLNGRGGGGGGWVNRRGGGGWLNRR